MKRTFVKSLSMALFCLLLLLPLTAYAVDVDTQRPCSLTLEYSFGEGVFAGVEVRAYRVARAESDGSYWLIPPYNGYPVDTYHVTSQAQWQEITETLEAYIAADGPEPTQTVTTDENGIAKFTGLETGLYLISGVVARNEAHIVNFSGFMVYLPTPVDTEANYDVIAKPKYSRYAPAPVEYSVVKLWKDNGAATRPASVLVELWKDGVLQETVTLSEENDWHYAWLDPDGTGVWTVVERDVPANYTVTTACRDTVFEVINTYDPPTPPDPDLPTTGDTAPVWLYIVAMCVSGTALAFMGAGGLGGKAREKK